jgi:hypothetical protein
MQPIDMRRRIRELLSIPDRDRSDDEWDELNELEIRTAPGNRDYDRAQGQGERRPGVLIGPGKRPGANKPQGNKNGNLLRPPVDTRADGGRMLKRQHRRPKRPGEMPGIGAPNDMSMSPITVVIPASDKSD